LVAVVPQADAALGRSAGDADKVDAVPVPYLRRR
jgi:hypothetical protein